MSSTESNSNKPGARGTSSNPGRSPFALVVVTIALLAGLVWALHPSNPHLVPAPLRPLPPGCLKGPSEFTPSNVTEISDLPLDRMRGEERNRVLLRLNMEPCTCGCGLSLASCRVSNNSCETSKAEAKRIVAEQGGEEKH
jgi:hypothetical protein